MTSCAECSELLGGYVLGALEPHEMEAVRSHLAECPRCAREAAWLAPVPALLELAGDAEGEAEHPPAALEDALLDRLALERRRARRGRAGRLGRWSAGRLPGRKAELPGPWPAAAHGGVAVRHRLLTRPALGLAGLACAAAIAIGALGLPGSGGAPARTQLVAALHGVQGESAATAQAVLTPQAYGTVIALDVRGLHASPRTVYELWCVRPDGGRISAGTFRVEQDGRATVRLYTAADPAQYRLLRVTAQGTQAGAPGGLWGGGSTGSAVMAGTIRE
jgi:anti-sigma factor RsiW